ncbi:MAG: hypothetical protein K6E85_03830 [Lachnospiraceae bacterium]|nr:hypothetical protein [Lachnospiraceae bacterium]
MATINVYKQYFAADARFNGVERKGALVMLISDSSAGMIKYTAGVTFSLTMMRRISPYLMTHFSKKFSMKAKAEGLRKRKKRS